MLATERPRMGSARPPHGEMPFNYDFPGHNEFGMPVAAPEPPRGEPLLTQNDSQLLMNFFQDVNSNQFNFSFGEGLSFSEDWLNLPPTFMGSSTSFGQQPSQPYSSVPPDFLGLDTANLGNMYHFGESMPSPHTPITPMTPMTPIHQHHRPITQPQVQHHHPAPHYPPPAPPQQHRPQRYQEPQHPQMHLHPAHAQIQHPLHSPTDHSAQEDIAAVLTAMGNGNQNGHGQNGHRIIQQPNQHSSRPTPYRSPTEPTRPTQPQHFGVQRQASHPGLQTEEETDNLFTNMVFGNSNIRHNRQPEERTELMWGSDSAFDRNQGYIPSSHNETAEALEKERLQYIKCFSINKSAANTQPSSPNPAAGDGAFVPNGHLGIVDEATETDGAMPPTKRRKSKAKLDVSGTSASSEPPVFEAKPPPPPPPKKRKPKAEANGQYDTANNAPATQASAAAASSTTPSETPKRKRPSAAAKPPRENLTDSQKRENHIKSEQRRRGAIKEGFDGLTEIIPNLKAGGYSKSMMLGMAGDWLQKLIDGNRALAGGQNL